MPFLMTRLVFALGSLGCANTPQNTDTSTASHDAGSDILLDAGGTDTFVPPMFDTREPLAIDIQIDPNDWEQLRHEGRSLIDVGCEPFSYTEFFGEVKIGDESFDQVRIRKKGFLGSLSVLRPSLKLNLAVNNPEQLYQGAKRLTLNNDRQDPSHVRQCLSYDLFRDAGLPAPFCGLARVTMNGADLGVYSNVEPIKKPFLARVFDDDSGNLYEGQGIDVTADQVALLQVKTNEKKEDISDLTALAQVMAAPDAEFEQRLATVINLEAFYTFWAMEVLTGHWDSYSGNRNNYYLYNNPLDGLFYFIPWGTDGAFTMSNPFLPDEQPLSVYYQGEISRRLFSLESGRARYKERLRELLETLWNEDRLLEDAKELMNAAGVPATEGEEVLTFISERRSVLTKALLLDTDVVDLTSSKTIPTCDPLVQTTGTMEVAWYTGGIPEDATFEGLELPFEGGMLTFEEGSSAGMALLDETSRSVLISAYGALKDTERMFWLGFFVPETLYTEGTVTFHGFETWGIMVELLPPTYEDGPTIGTIGGGTLTLERVTQTTGETVRISWDALIADWDEP